MNRSAQSHRRGLLVALFAALSLGGCSGLDSSLKDAEWFSKPTVFSRSMSLETPPLSNSAPVVAADLISAEGYCAGMAAPADANALTDASQAPRDPAQGSSGIGIGRTECEVARVAGSPDNVSITGEGGRRMTVLTYVRGPRPGIYRFAEGRMVSMERGAEPEPQPRQAKGKAKPKPKSQG